MKSFQIALGRMLAITLGATLGVITASAQQYTISTAAGIGTVMGWYGDEGPATAAELDVPTSITVDSKGNYYFVDSQTNIVREVSAGIINTVAGNGTAGFTGDNGPAAQAELSSSIHGVAVDSGGNIYIADTGNSRVREVNVSGSIVVNTTGTTGDGNTVLTVASKSGIQVNMTVTGAGIQPGTVVSSINSTNNTVNLSLETTAGLSATPVTFALTHIVTFAGGLGIGYTGDGGQATAASLYRPAGLAVDPSGNVYIADTGNSTVRKVTTSGIITTVAGTGVFGNSGDGGPANQAMLGTPESIVIDASGNIYISDTSNSDIREITTDGKIHTVASNISVSSFAIDAGGNIYFPDYVAETVQKLFPNGEQLTIAGNGTTGFSGDGGPATGAQFDGPAGVALDSSGDIYVTDSQNMVVRMLTPVTSSIGIVNAASGVGGVVVPGEIVVLYGNGIGPATLVSNQPVNGYFGTQVGGTTVSFDGNPAPLIYSSATQVAAVVPFEEVPGNTANVTLTYKGQTLTATLPVALQAPGVFTANASGSGEAAALNYGPGGSVTPNSAANPAPVGSYISIYATGAGQMMNPGGVDGQLTPAGSFPQPVQSVRATVAGEPAVVTYAGGAPGEVEGLVQVNLQIPMIAFQSGEPPLSVPVMLFVTGIPSQITATIFISSQ